MRSRQDQLDAAIAHLGSPQVQGGLEHPSNAAMLDSIQASIGAGIPLTPPQQTFLDHEILEASHVANGMGVGPAHELVLETYPAGSTYSPEVILEFEEWFSDTILDYWGLERPDK